MGNLIKRFVVEEEGLELLEVAIVGFLFVLTAAAVIATLGGTVAARLSDVNNSAFTKGS